MAQQTHNSTISAIPKLNVNDRFTLSQTDASYLLSLELETAIGKFCPQEGACEIPVPKQSGNQGDAVLFSHFCKKNVKF